MEEESCTRLENGPNGTGIVLKNHAQGLALYPHARIFGGLIHVAGTSSRRADNTHEGVSIDPATGKVVAKDIREQTRAVLRNIEKILRAAHPNATLRHVVDLSVFLVDMQDYKAMNEVYNEFFTDAAAGPTRTTVAVHQLPHPNLLVEMKCTAVLPPQQD